MNAFTPTGKLRAAINLGNPILANRDASGKPFGVSIDLASAFAAELDAELELVVFEKAAASVDAVRSEQADIGFFAIDPARSDGLRFTAAYVLIEGCYLVPNASVYRTNAQVDAAGTRIAVGAGSAYDLFLTREIKIADLVRLQGAAAVVAALRDGSVDVAAGIRQVLTDELQRAPGLRLLPERFMLIEQAMGTPASRGDSAQAALTEFVERMKSTGFVTESLKRHGIHGASVAPLR